MCCMVLVGAVFGVCGLLLLFAGVVCAVGVVCWRCCCLMSLSLLAVRCVLLLFVVDVRRRRSVLFVGVDVVAAWSWC